MPPSGQPGEVYSIPAARNKSTPRHRCGHWQMNGACRFGAKCTSQPAGRVEDIQDGSDGISYRVSTSEIKKRAKESISNEARGLSALALIRTARTQILSAQEQEGRGDLALAYASYIKAATLVTLIIGSPEIVQNAKDTSIRMELDEFLKNDGRDIRGRTMALEEKLEVLEAGHTVASTQRSSKSVICRNWQKDGKCRFGQRCRFSHTIQDNEEKRAKAEGEEKQREEKAERQKQERERVERGRVERERLERERAEREEAEREEAEREEAEREEAERKRAERERLERERLEREKLEQERVERERAEKEKAEKEKAEKEKVEREARERSEADARRRDEVVQERNEARRMHLEAENRKQEALQARLRNKERLAREKAAEEAEKMVQQARRKKEAAVNEQSIVSESNLVTYSAGMDIQRIVSGFDLCRITIKNLPMDANLDGIADIFIQRGFVFSEFSVQQTKPNRGERETVVLAKFDQGQNIVARLEGITFRNQRLTFEVSENASWNGMSTAARNATFLAAPRAAPLLTKTIQYSIKIPCQQYQAQKTRWDELSERKSFLDAHLQIIGDGGDVFIHVFGQDKRAAGPLKVKVEGMVAGEKLDARHWHTSFAFPSGKLFFARVCNKVQVYIRRDFKTHCLRVYGEPSRVREAKRMIRKEVKRLAETETTIDLPPACARVFMREGLGRLKELIGEDNVAVNVASWPYKVTVKGGVESTQYLNSLVEQSRAIGTFDEIFRPYPICPICTGDVLNPEELGCGHIYCSGCLSHLFTSAMDSKKFPIVCVGNGDRCRVPIAIPFIRRFLPRQSFENLVETAFAAYLEQHPQELKYCPTLDCKQIYRRRMGKALLKCPACCSLICPLCDEAAHEGMTCEERKVYLEEEKRAAQRSETRRVEQEEQAREELRIRENQERIARIQAAQRVQATLTEAREKARAAQRREALRKEQEEQAREVQRIRENQERVARLQAAQTAQATQDRLAEEEKRRREEDSWCIIM